MGDYKAILETTTTRLEIHKSQPTTQQQTTVPLTEKQKIFIHNPADLYPVMRSILLREDENSRRKEHFWVVGLRSDNRILYIELVSLGNASSAVADPLDVYQLAVVNKSSRIMVVHNHIDAGLKPSESDKTTTQNLIEGGKLLNIQVLDHLIISEDGYFSFLEEGLIEMEENGEG